MTLGDFYVQWFWVAMNKNKYNSLPKDIQKIIDECSGSVGADLLGKAWNAADKDGFEIGKKNGMEIITLSDEEMDRRKEQCAPISEEWVNKMEKKGYPGRKFVETGKELIRHYNDEFGSWQD